MMRDDPLLIAVEGTQAARRVIASRGMDPVPELEHAAQAFAELEWSGVRHGQGFGPHGSGNDGHPYAACPVCGGLQEPNREFIESAVGHRSGCRLAAALGSPTAPAEDGQERMPV